MTSLLSPPAPEAPSGPARPSWGFRAFLAALLLFAAALCGPALMRARPSPGVVEALGDVRTMASAQRAYQSAFGGFGTPRCLRAPAECHPGYAGPVFLEGELRVDGDRGGYRYRFHAGRAAGPDLAEWAFTAEALQPGGRSYCADAAGAVCATEPEPNRWGGFVRGAARAPQVEGARCARCEPLR